ncbi:MAG: SBBP repeat-containing protein [Bryobacteraceae bacterium]
MICRVLIAASLPFLAFAAGTGQSNKARADFARMLLYFEENRGQAAADVRFLARGGGHPVAVMDSGVEIGSLSMRLVGARSAKLTPRVPLEGRVNYFIGADPKKWHRQIPTFARVEAAGVYDGIDLVYYGHEREFEYDLVVHPGADPGKVEMQFTGAKRLRVDAAGALVAETAQGPVRWKKPVVYQAGRKTIDGGYVLAGDRVRFRVGAYDRSRVLTIDPVLEYAIAVPGTNGYTDAVNGIALDSAGNVYVAGQTSSPVAREASANRDLYGMNAFVAKLSANGTGFSFFSYLGGTGEEAAKDIVVDRTGAAIVTGSTSSYDFPSVPGPRQSGGNGDAFVVKLSPAGDAITLSMVLGGGSVEDARRVILEPDDTVTMVGSTLSRDFPLVNPVQPTIAGLADGWVARIRLADGAMLFSTYLGTPGSDTFQGAAVNPADRSLYVAGQTLDPFAPNAGQTMDCLVARLVRDGERYAIDYINRLGGSKFDACYDVAADEAFVYVGGMTSSDDLPVRAALQPARVGGADMFFGKLEQAAPGRVAFLTYLGSKGTDQVNRIAVENGSLVFAGIAGDTGLATLDAIQPTPRKSSVPVRSLDGGETWQPLGTRDNLIRAIASDPADASRMYAVGDELYTSSDGGDSWSAMSGLPFLPGSISAFAVSPRAVRLWAATFEGGIYSADPAGNWRRALLRDVYGIYAIDAIAADPVDPMWAYARESTRLFRTADGGTSWAGVFGTRTLAQRYVAVNPVNPQVVWTSGDTGPVRSNNRGANWVEAGVPYSNCAVFAAAPSDPATAYCLGGNGLFYRTSDGGITWSQTTPPPISPQSLTVSPANPELVYGADRAGLYRTTDGGVSWAPVPSFPAGTVAAIHIPPADPSRIYVTRQFANDAAIGRLSPEGKLEFFTYLGSARADSISALAVSRGAIYLGGGTGDASSFPFTRNGEVTRRQSAFAAKISPASAACVATAGARSGLVFDADGGSADIVVQAPSGCGWTVSSSADWLTPSISSGFGTAHVSLFLSRNPEATRTGAIQIGVSRTLVTQAAKSCSFSFVPTALWVPPTAGSTQVELLTDEGCPWSLQDSTLRYFTVSPTSGTGPTQLTVTRMANSDGQPRQDLFRVVNRDLFSILQFSVPPCASSAEASPTRFPPEGGSGKITIKAPPDCARNASGSFVKITSGQGGSGDGDLEFEVDINLDPKRRSEAITPGGLPVIVTQDGSCGSDLCPFGGPAIIAPRDQVSSFGFTASWKPLPDVVGYQLWVVQYNSGKRNTKVIERNLDRATTRTELVLPPGPYTLAVRGCTAEPFGTTNCGAFSSIGLAVK